MIKGRKSDDERFAGAINTTTVELYVPISGRGIQGATSHMLGQNFSKMFEVWYEDANKEKNHVWQTSWGLSTRSIGAMLMIHSDNTGVVLPPKVAQTQIVIIPILYKNDDSKALVDKAYELRDQLKKAGLRVQVDDSDNHNPGFKFNQWEVKGTPVRLEIGAKDFQKNEVRCCIRHSGAKSQVKQESIVADMQQLMLDIHQQMFDKAKAARDSHLKEVSNWEEFMDAMNAKNICLAPWCDQQKCEIKIKEQSKEESMQKMLEANEDESLLTGAAKTLCIPYEIGNQDLKDGEKCFYCGEQAKVTAVWGRSY